MKLILKAQREQMLANGRLSAQGHAIDPEPVVKLFTPDGAATWLLTELDPMEPDIAFGLCDLGMGCPELGTVSMAELETVRGRLGLLIERDQWFAAKGPLSAYAEAARRAEHITEIIAETEGGQLTPLTVSHRPAALSRRCRAKPPSRSDFVPPSHQG